MELFCSADGEFLPEDGEKIMPIDDLYISLDEGLLTVSCMSMEEEASVILALHSTGKGELA